VEGRKRRVKVRASGNHPVLRMVHRTETWGGMIRICQIPEWRGSVLVSILRTLGLKTLKPLSWSGVKSCDTVSRHLADSSIARR
jgi:hypothetical protein